MKRKCWKIKRKYSFFSFLPQQKRTSWMFYIKLTSNALLPLFSVHCSNTLVVWQRKCNFQWNFLCFERLLKRRRRRFRLFFFSWRSYRLTPFKIVYPWLAFLAKKKNWKFCRHDRRLLYQEQLKLMCFGGDEDITTALVIYLWGAVLAYSYVAVSLLILRVFRMSSAHSTIE